jgi:glycosyltransferase involved in cell wall biosynthesis
MTKNLLLLAKGLGRGGAERLLVSGIRYLDRSRYHVEVAYLLPWKDALVGELESLDVPVHLLDNRRALDPRWALRLRPRVTDRGVDLVHTHMPYVAIGARLVVPRRVSLVHTEHNLWSRYRTPTRVANMMTIGRNREVIAVSAAVAASMRIPPWAPISLPPVEVVRHGADVAQISFGADARAGARARLGLADDEHVVGTVGNFTAKKDQASLLRAVALLTAQERPVRAVLVGTGPLEEELRGLASSLGIESRILFAGMREDVFEILCGFDVFALSSRFEGLPIAMLEAMAAHVPPVATRVGGIPEVITDECDGLLVAPEDPASLAAAIGRLLDDDNLREKLGAAAAARSAEFDLAQAVARTQSLYDTALGLS